MARRPCLIGAVFSLHRNVIAPSERLPKACSASQSARRTHGAHISLQQPLSNLWKDRFPTALKDQQRSGVGFITLAISNRGIRVIEILISMKELRLMVEVTDADAVVRNSAEVVSVVLTENKVDLAMLIVGTAYPAISHVQSLIGSFLARRCRHLIIGNVDLVFI